MESKKLRWGLGGTHLPEISGSNLERATLVGSAAQHCRVCSSNLASFHKGNTATRFPARAIPGITVGVDMPAAKVPEILMLAVRTIPRYLCRGPTLSLTIRRSGNGVGRSSLVLYPQLPARSQKNSARLHSAADDWRRSNR